MSLNKILIIWIRDLSTQSKSRLSASFGIRRVNGWSNDCETYKLSKANLTALKHFDHYYAHVYGNSAWSSMRAALLCPNAKVAVINACYPHHLSVISHLTSPSNKFLDILKCLRTTSASSSKSSYRDFSNQSDENAIQRGVQYSSDSQFLIRSDTESEGFSEFVPPTQFITERLLFSRDSETTFKLSNPSTCFSPNPLALIDEDDIVDDIGDATPGNLMRPSLWDSYSNLRCLVPPSGKCGTLGRPSQIEGSFAFYPLDMGSVLAVLALGVRPGTRLLDMCSAPGGKAVLALQTLNIERLVCVDVSPARIERLRRVLASFTIGVGVNRSNLPDVVVSLPSGVPALCRTASMGRSTSSDLFDRVLVDVPCSTDRHALTTDSGNLFSKGKSHTRIHLPERQKGLLLQAMLACRRDGCIVYSTCTLSPAQNQAVVESCLSQLVRENSRFRFAIVDPLPMIRLIKRCLLLNIAISPVFSTLRVNHVNHSKSIVSHPIGFQILPRLASNFGPTFICKIRRIE